MKIAGRYEVLGTIAHGGTSSVLRARDVTLDRDVAVKRLAPGVLDTRGRARHQREARVLGNVRHPGVVRVLDVGEDRGAPFLVMELVRGVTLADEIERFGPLPVDRAVELTSRLAGALAAAHAIGVLHRDVKPSNVLVRADDGHPVLVDFGLAGWATERRPDHLENSNLGLSADGEFLGTPGFCAPEQALGRLDQIGPTADVYGLGATLFAMLTGRPPFDGTSLYEVVTRLVRERAPAPSQRRPEVPAWIDAVCARALESDPTRRFAGMDELAAVLEAGGRGSGGGSPRGRVARPTERRPLVALGAIAAAVVATATTVGAVVLSRSGGAPGDDPPPDRASAAAPSTPTTPASISSPTAAPESAPQMIEGAEVEVEVEVDDEVVEDIDGLVRAVRELSATDKIDDRARLDAAIAAAPADVGLRLRRAAHFLADGLGDGARGDLDIAVALAPERPDAYALRAKLFKAAGRQGLARADLDRAIELDGERLHDLESRAFVRARIGDLAGALDDAERSIELAVRRGVESTGAYVARGVIRFWSGDPAGAREDYAEAIAANPGSAVAWYDRSEVRWIEGDLAGARADVDRAVELLPSYRNAWLYACLIRRAGGDLEAAADAGLRAVSDDPSIPPTPPPSAVDAARLDAAIETWLAFFAERYEFPDAWAARGWARSTAGDREGALADLRRFLEHAPEHPIAAAIRRLVAELEAGG